MVKKATGLTTVDYNDLGTLKVGTPNRTRFNAEQSLSTELLAISNKIGERRQALETEELTASWQTALDLSEVANNEKYGPDAVQQIATHNGLSREQVRQLLLIAEYVREDTFDKIVAYNKTKLGRYGRMTFSHLVELAKVHDPKKQEAFRLQAQAEGTGYRELKDRITDYLRQQQQEEEDVEVAVKPNSILKTAKRSSLKLQQALTALNQQTFVDALMSKASVSKASSENIVLLLQESKEIMSNTYSLLAQSAELLANIESSIVNGQKQMAIAELSDEIVKGESAEEDDVLASAFATDFADDSSEEENGDVVDADSNDDGESPFGDD